MILSPMESFPSGVEGSAGSSLPGGARLDVTHVDGVTLVLIVPVAPPIH